MSGTCGTASSNRAVSKSSGVLWIPGNTFRMGADQSYFEEVPVHAVAVSGCWMDEHTVTNADLGAFTAATGYVAVAERPLDPAAYPGAQPELLTPGAAVFHISIFLRTALARPAVAATGSTYWVPIGTMQKVPTAPSKGTSASLLERKA